MPCAAIAMEVPVAGMDVVEVSPPYDTAEVTAYLGNRVVLEALSGIAWRRRPGGGRGRGGDGPGGPGGGVGRSGGGSGGGRGGGAAGSGSGGVGAAGAAGVTAGATGSGSGRDDPSRSGRCSILAGTGNEAPARVAPLQ